MDDARSRDRAENAPSTMWTLSPSELRKAKDIGFDTSAWTPEDPTTREGYREVTPSDNSVSVGDYGRAAVSGTAGLGAGVGALSSWATDGAVGGDTRKFFDDISQDQNEKMGPRARRAMSAEFFADEGKQGILDDFANSLGLKTAAALPSTVASIIPGGIAARVFSGASLGTRVAAAGATSRGANAVMNAGDVASQIYSAIDKMSDADLQKEAPVYAGYRAMMGEKDAREKYMSEVAGAAPVIGFIVGAATPGVETMVAQRLGGEAAKGMLRGAGKGALGEATQEFAENTTGEFASQQALIIAGLKSGMDWEKVLAQGLEGALVGAGMGGATGGITNIGKGGKSGMTVVDGPVDAAQSLALGGKQSAPAGQTTTAELPPQSGNSNDTVSEKPQTLQDQQDKLVNGEIPAMLFTPGDEELAVPDGFERYDPKNMGDEEVRAKGEKLGILHYDPKVFYEYQIEDAIRDDRINDILGYVQSKEEVDAREKQGVPPVAVTERAPDGTERRAAATSMDRATEQADLFKRQKSPDSTVQVESPQDVLEGRQAPDDVKARLAEVAKRIEARRTAQPQEQAPPQPQAQPQTQGDLLRDASVPEGVADAMRRRKDAEQQDYDDAWEDYQAEKAALAARGEEAARPADPLAAQDTTTNEGYRAFYEGDPIQEDAPPATASAPTLFAAEPTKAEKAKAVAKERAEAKATKAKATAEKAAEQQVKAEKAKAVAKERADAKAAKVAPPKSEPGALSKGRKGKKAVDAGRAAKPKMLDADALPPAPKPVEATPAPQEGGAMTQRQVKQGELFTGKVSTVPGTAVVARPASTSTAEPAKKLSSFWLKKVAVDVDEETTDPSTGKNWTKAQLAERKAVADAAEAAFAKFTPDADEVYTGPEQTSLPHVILQAKVEPSTFIQSPRQVVALRKRLAALVAEVEKAGKIPAKIYEGAPDALAFARQAKDALAHYLGKNSKEAVEKTNAFIADELAARKGDFEPLRKRRLQEGDQAKRAYQGDIEKVGLTTDGPDAILDKAEASLQRELAWQEMERQREETGELDIAAVLRAAGREDLIDQVDMEKIKGLIESMGDGARRISNQELTSGEAEILSFLNQVYDETHYKKEFLKSLNEDRKFRRIEVMQRGARNRAESYARDLENNPNQAYQRPNGSTVISSRNGIATALDTVKLSQMLRQGNNQLHNLVDGGGPLGRPVADLITRLAADVDVHILEDADFDRLYGSADGVFSGGFIALPARILSSGDGYARARHVVLHEGAHAALTAKVKSDPLAISQIKAIANQVLKANPEAGKLYAFTDAQEFLAEALSNEAFQRLLAGTNLTPGLAAQLGISGAEWRGKSMWWGLLNKFAQWLGVERSENNLDALSGILSVVDRLADGRPPVYAKGWSRYFKPEGLKGDSTPLSPQRGAAARPAKDPTALFLTSEELLNGGKDKAGAFQNWMSRVAVKGTTLDQLRQLHKGLFTDAKGDALERVVAGIQRMAPYAQGKREAAERLAQQFINYARANPERAAKLADLAIDATMTNVRLGPNADNKHLGKGWRGWQGVNQLPALQGRFNNELDAEGRKLYQEMSSFYRTQQNEMTQGLIDNILKEVAVEPQDRDAFIKRVMNGNMSITDEALLKDKPTALKALKEANELRTLQGDYFPLMRNGDYVVTTRDDVKDTGAGTEIEPGKVEFRSGSRQGAMRLAKAFADTTDMRVLSVQQSKDTSTSTDFGVVVHLQTRGAYFFESEAEAFKWRRENEGKFSQVSQVQDKRQTGLNSADLTTAQFNTLMGSIDRQSNVDDNTKDMMKGMMQQAAARMMSGNRVQQRSIIRRNVQGASTDFGRNLMQYGKATSGYLAKIKYMPEIREALKSMGDLASDDFSGQGAARSKVINEVRARIDQNVISPNDAPQWLNDLMGLTFLGKLFSPMYSVINGMQPWMVTMPVLAGRFGSMRANAALISAYNALGFTDAIGGGIRNSYLGGKQFNAAGLLDTSDIVGGIKKKLAKQPDGAQLSTLIDELQERGAMSSGGFEMAQALAEGRGWRGQALSKVDRIARQLPQAVEDVNRASSAIAAYRLARAAGMNEEKARAYAFDVVMNTQGDYSGVNAPRFFANPYLRPALQFKKYAQMMAYLLADMTHKSFKGASPEERSQARKALLNVFAVQIAMAGALGLPGLEIVKLGFMVAAVFGAGQGWDDQEERLRKLADESFGKTWGELVSKGVISRAIGIDISGRVSLSDMFIFGEPKKYDKENLQGYFAQTMFGAPGSTAFDFVKGWQEIGQGEAWAKGLSKMIPVKFAADMLKAYNNYDEGKATGAEVALNAFGARSARQAEKSRETAEGIRQRDEMQDRYKSLQREYLRARNAGQLAVARAKMVEHNKEAPLRYKLFPNALDKVREKIKSERVN